MAFFQFVYLYGKRLALHFSLHWTFIECIRPFPLVDYNTRLRHRIKMYDLDSISSGISPWFGLQATIVWFPPFSTTVLSSPISAATPSIRKFVPFPGTVTIPFVPSGVCTVILVRPPSISHFAPNHPRGVSNPPSAAFKSPGCGVSAHERPCNDVICNPRA